MRKPRARTKGRKEADIQRDLIAFCAAVLPPTARTFAIPNASRRTHTGRASNAVPGLLPGASDLICLPCPGIVIFPEVKRPGEKPEDHQEAFGAAMRVLGHHYCVWTCIEDARNTFAALGVKTREVLPELVMFGEDAA